jgi:hypothetical protein
VVRNLDCKGKSDSRLAIHAMFGANPWTPMTWMGHKAIAETMRYVHVASVHSRPIPTGSWRPAQERQIQTGAILRMLGNRANQVPTETGSASETG